MYIYCIYCMHARFDKNPYLINQNKHKHNKTPLTVLRTTPAKGCPP